MAENTRMRDVKQRRGVVFIAEDNRTVELITANMEWSVATIGELYRRRWIIETAYLLF